MSLTRSEFLRSVGVSAGAAFLGVRRGFASGDGNRGMLEEMSKEAFSANLRTEFRLLDKTSPIVIDVELVEVREGASSSKVEQFSLLFHGPAEPRLSQQTYRVEHPVMGDFELFLVPVGADEAGTSYEAIFSRMTHAD